MQGENEKYIRNFNQKASEDGKMKSMSFQRVSYQDVERKETKQCEYGGEQLAAYRRTIR